VQCLSRRKSQWGGGTDYLRVPPGLHLGGMPAAECSDNGPLYRPP